MRDGICPKCGSREIYTKKPGMMGNYHILTLSAFDTVPFQDYVCVACGYIESYINDQNALDRIAEKWQPVITDKRKNDAL